MNPGGPVPQRPRYRLRALLGCAVYVLLEAVACALIFAAVVWLWWHVAS